MRAFNCWLQKWKTDKPKRGRRDQKSKGTQFLFPHTTNPPLNNTQSLNKPW